MDFLSCIILSADAGRCLRLRSRPQLLASVAVLRLQFANVPWVQEYVHNARGFFTANNIDDFSAANPIRFTMINLQVPLFSVTGHSSSANLLAFSAGAVLMLSWLYLLIRNGKDESELLSLGAISIIGLLPVYHRFYDAGFLAVPLCWCVAQRMGRAKGITRIAVLLMTPFLAPATAFLLQMAREDRIPGAVTRSWWWNCAVMPHETWTLLLLSLVLLYAMTLRPSR